MTSVKVLLVIFIIGICFQVKSALQCYSCSSEKDEANCLTKIETCASSERECYVNIAEWSL